MFLFFCLIWFGKIHAHYTYGIHNMNITVLFNFIAHTFASFWKMEKPKILYEIIILLLVMFSISIQLAYRYWHNIQHVPYTIERKNQVKLLYHCGISKIIVFISIEIIYGVTHLKSTIKLKIILPFHLFSQQKRKLFSVSWFFFLGFSFLFCLISLIY